MATEQQKDLFRTLKNFLWSNDVPRFKEEWARLPQEERYDLLCLSFSEVDGNFLMPDYLLHLVIHSLCDSERANIPGNDPDLIDCVLAGLSGEQRIHVLDLRNHDENTPFDILAPSFHLETNVYTDILRNLLAGLTPNKKFQALMNSQRRKGAPLKYAIFVSPEAVAVIREGLSDRDFYDLSITESQTEWGRNPLIWMVRRNKADLIGSTLSCITGEERVTLLTKFYGKISLILEAIRCCPPETIRVLLEGLNAEEVGRVYRTKNEEGVSPLTIIVSMTVGTSDLADIFNTSVQGPSDQPVLADNNTLVATNPAKIEGFQNKVSALCQAISGRGSDPIPLIKNLSNPDLWAIIGGKNNNSIRPIDLAISYNNDRIDVLDEIAQRTPVSVRKSLLMDEEGHPCSSLLELIRHHNIFYDSDNFDVGINRNLAVQGMLRVLLSKFNPQDRQELLITQDQGGISIQSLIQEEEKAKVNLQLCFLPQSLTPS